MHDCLKHSCVVVYLDSIKGPTTNAPPIIGTRKKNPFYSVHNTVIINKVTITLSQSFYQSLLETKRFQYMRSR